MRQTSLASILICLILVPALPSAAWDKYGHMVIAQIAWDRMTPEARSKTQSMIDGLATDPDVTDLDPVYQPYNPVTVAAWMDDIRSKSKAYNTWHYVDLPDTGVDAQSLPAKFEDLTDPNVLAIITKKCLPTLQDPAASAADKSKMLGFLFHLEGDIHQPLHAIGRDLGGNKYPIDELPGADPNWKITNLHSFWDNAYRYDTDGGKIVVKVTDLDMPRVMKPGDRALHRLARQLEREFGKSDATLSQDLNPVDWALESYQAANTVAYAPGMTHALTADYVRVASKTARARLYLAGTRLGNLLNGLFAPSAKPTASSFLPPAAQSASTSAAGSLATPLINAPAALTADTIIQ